MKKLKWFAALSVLLGFAGLWVAYAQSSQDLAPVDKIGWWTRRPGAMPEGNANTFEVAAGVQGEESVAALRVLIKGEVTKATLIMSEADAPLAPLNPGKLKVCTTSVPWLVADGGAYADAPKPDCGTAVELKRTADPSGVGTWTADVTAMLTGARSEVSLMVLPIPDTSSIVPSTYFIKLTARIDAEGTADVVPAAAPTAIRPSPTIGSNSSASRPSAPAAVVTAPAAASTPTTQVAAATATSVPKRFTLASTPKPQKPWGKLFILIPLAAIGGALYNGGRRFWVQRERA
jgi:hypothetical protein